MLLFITEGSMSLAATIKENPSTNQMPRFLDEVGVETHYCISRKTLRNWRIFGKGPPYRKFGASVRYEVRALEEWAQSTPCGGAGIPASSLKK
jgi:hypothetical protein